MKIYRLGKLLPRTAQGVAVLILLAAAAIMIPLAMLGMFGRYLLDTLYKKERMLWACANALRAQRFVPDATKNQSLLRQI